jgi:hypothetical protein
MLSITFVALLVPQFAFPKKTPCYVQKITKETLPIMSIPLSVLDIKSRFKVVLMSSLWHAWVAFSLYKKSSMFRNISGPSPC